jgi:hypothetical protein
MSFRILLIIDGDVRFVECADAWTVLWVKGKRKHYSLGIALLGFYIKMICKSNFSPMDLLKHASPDIGSTHGV